jgi:hypothetical protein
MLPVVTPLSGYFIARNRGHPWNSDAGGFRQFLDLKRRDPLEKDAAWVDIEESHGNVFLDLE